MRIPSSITLLIVTLLASTAAAGQQAHRNVTVRAVSEETPVEGARVSSGSIRAIADTRGEALLRLPLGDQAIRVEAIGYESASIDFTLAAGGDTLIVVEL